MEAAQIQEIIKTQRKFFKTGATLPVEYRIQGLKRLYRSIQKHEVDIHAAIKKDLGKSKYESYMCEVGMVLSEISHMISHTRRYAGERRVLTPLAQYVSRSFEKPVPYGTVLIMSPWNYPFMLTIEPLVDALAAGNTCVVKPSAYSPATSEVITKILKECFPSKYVAVVNGGRAENSCLLEQKFDYIFFTGSQNVGKEVLRKAAEHLTPVTLELGGKSPCIVDETANIKLAAKRIVFGKFLNCGQTCVAPDYLYCHEAVKDKLLEEIKKQVQKQYGKQPLNNKNYGKIINEKHFERVSSLIAKEKVIIGGHVRRETLQIEPTVLSDVTWNDAVMQEEIFGPILPVLTYTSLDDLFERINEKQHPLAAYFFSQDQTAIKQFTSVLAFGGGCINDTIIHLATSNLGFGGVGESGMGAYHGKIGFDTFSHKKSMVDKKTWLDLPMRYQPYNRIYHWLVRMFLR